VGGIRRGLQPPEGEPRDDFILENIARIGKSKGFILLLFFP
jgi:hypothetical protein